MKSMILPGLLLLGSAACGIGNEHPPDQVLQDSLGLDASDEVHRVELSGEGNRESASPAEVRIAPGAWVEFRTGDRRLHLVRFLTDSLPGEGGDFLRRTEQDASPPLLELDARFLVSFDEAPEGRYPYEVDGNGAPVRGVVIVEAKR